MKKVINVQIRDILEKEGIEYTVKDGILVVSENMLDLSRKQITSLEGFEFNGEWLYLKNNQISSLAGFEFNGKELYLSNNQISSLAGFEFNGEYLYLRDNQISSLAGFEFNGEELCLYGNPKLDTNVERCGMLNRTIYSYYNSGNPIVVIGCRHESPESCIAAIRKEYTGEKADEYIQKVKSCVEKLKKIKNSAGKQTQD